MANKTVGKGVPVKSRGRAGSAKPAGGAKKIAGKRGAAGARAQRNAAARILRTDHTPPPLLFGGGGSITIETDERLSREGGGGPHRPHLHKFASARPIKGLKVLNDSGRTLIERDHADGMSVKIWWDDSTAEPQIFVDPATLTIEADVHLANSVPIERPPRPKGTPPTQRILRYTHPAVRLKGIERVLIEKGGQIIFDERERLNEVMIWDTEHIVDR